MKKLLLFTGIILCSAAVLALGGMHGSTKYFAANQGAACADCHEMSNYVNTVHVSTHRGATCLECHDASWSTKLRHARIHFFGNVPEQIHLRETDVQQMMGNCQSCHQKEFAAWQAGGHSATYAAIFTNPAHNAKRRLMDDCFRCHGMYYNGSIRDIVQPQDTHGPWHLTNSEMANKPAIPCQSCHWIHRVNSPLIHSGSQDSIADTTVRNSVGFFDRREEMHFAASTLPLPVLNDGARAIKESTDQRQALCYQCHAPRQPEANSIAAINHWGPQAGSGDDRTPTGVHEGLSCVDCHKGHDEGAKDACSTCHTSGFHHGMDVQKLDTTYADKTSKHNIHWVKCEDCHQNGVPKTR